MAVICCDSVICDVGEDILMSSATHILNIET